MIKSDIEIKDDIHAFIKGTTLEKNVSGKLSKTKRPENSDKEDIVISILENNTGQMQDAFVFVNIYFPDNNRNNQYEEDSIRLRKLCKMSYELLEVGHGKGFRFTLDKQRVLEVNGKNEHVISNKLLYKQNNE